MNSRSRRRAYATGSIALIGALALAGCSQGTAEAGDTASTEFVFVGTGGSYQDAQRAAMLDPFMEESGISYVEDSPATWTKMTAQVDAGNVTWDVVEALPYYAIDACGDYLEKIDYDIVDVSAIDPALVSECGVPNMRTAFLLVYNTEKYGDAPPTSWADFYDTEKFPGTRGMMGNEHDGSSKPLCSPTASPPTTCTPRLRPGILGAGRRCG